VGYSRETQKIKRVALDLQLEPLLELLTTQIENKESKGTGVSQRYEPAPNELRIISEVAGIQKGFGVGAN
jgi:hypothetical protein